EVDPPPAGHGHAVTALAFTPEGKLLASSGSDQRIQLWDTVSGSPVPGPSKGGTAWGLAFSADARLLAIATDAGQVELWDMTTGQYSGSPLYRAEQHPGRYGYSLWGISVTGSIAPSSLPPPGPIYTEPGPHPLVCLPPEQPRGTAKSPPD